MTYFLDREDGTWIGMGLRVAGRRRRLWIVQVESKDDRIENVVWLACGRPRRRRPSVWPVEGRTVRGTCADPFDYPLSHATLAMNLLEVRHYRATRAALKKAPVPARHPCGITEVHRLVAPGPGFDKHIDLEPRVRITGVACQTAGGGRNPITATSFGSVEPVAGGEPLDDFVDLAYPKEIEHDGFALTYPATWFLRGTPDPEPESGWTDLSAHLGGASCAATLAVRIGRASAAGIAAAREDLTNELLGAKEVGGADLRYRPTTPPDAPEAVLRFTAEHTPPGIDGHSVAAIYQDGDRLARVVAFGCVARAHPLRPAIFAGMRRCFDEILGSFRFR